MLSVKGLSKIVSPDFQLSSIHFDQLPGEKLALVGLSGSGKSTLLQLLAGWQQPDTGTITLFSEKIKGPHEQLVPGHPGLAFLQQSSHLPHHYYIRDLFQYANVWESTDANRLFSICRIEHLFHRKHHEISGGEQQRIALALLLITSPRWLLLDEPFSHLDLPNKRILQQILLEVSTGLGITCLLCSHNPEDIFGWADRILVLENGKLVQSGTPEQIYQMPVNTYVAGLLGDFYPLSAELAAQLIPELYSRQTGYQWIIRPEQLIVDVHPFDKAVIGKISKVSFYGKEYKIDLEVINQVLSFYSTHNRWESGSVVYLRASSGYGFLHA
jgi:iron(III) transport system ATP-binding protein